MFCWLGGSLAALGGVGLAVGLGGVRHGAEALAVAAGLVLLAIIAAYSRGAFRRDSSPHQRP
jgi:hypothetical protein